MKYAVLIAFSLLAACAANEQASAPVSTGGESSSRAEASQCIRGAIDATRSFVVCPAGASSEQAVAAALQSPADLSLDLAGVARRYGVPRQSLSGIEAATYARIVPDGSRRDLPPAADDSETGQALEIDGRSFSTRAIDASDESAVIFVEQPK